MLAYGKKIVILPFKRDISSIKTEGESSEGDISLEGLRLELAYMFMLDLSLCFINTPVETKSCRGCKLLIIKIILILAVNPYPLAPVRLTQL